MGGHMLPVHADARESMNELSQIVDFFDEAAKLPNLCSFNLFCVVDSEHMGMGDTDHARLPWPFLCSQHGRYLTCFVEMAPLKCLKGARNPFPALEVMIVSLEKSNECAVEHRQFFDFSDEFFHFGRYHQLA